VVGAGGEAEACDGGAQERVAGLADAAEVMEVARGHVGIGVHVGALGEAGELDLTGAADPLADGLGRLAGAPVRQLA